MVVEFLVSAALVLGPPTGATVEGPETEAGDEPTDDPESDAAILDGELNAAEMTVDPVFGFRVPAAVPGVPAIYLQPRARWADAGAFDSTAGRLAQELVRHFAQFERVMPTQVREAGPALSAVRGR